MSEGTEGTFIARSRLGATPTTDHAYSPAIQTHPRGLTKGTFIHYGAWKPLSGLLSLQSHTHTHTEESEYLRVCLPT